MKGIFTRQACVIFCIGWLLLGGCSDSKDSSPSDATVDQAVEADVGPIPDIGIDSEPVPQEPMSYLTYNLGLVASVVLDRERKPMLIEAIHDLEVDVICFNELWFDDDAQEFIDGLKDKWPHYVREVTSDDSEPEVHCQNLMALLALQKCIQEKCTPQGISFEECANVEELCMNEKNVLTDDCLICLAANLATGEPQICGLGGGKKFSADGRNGLMIFSKFPIDSTKYTSLDTIIVKRGVLSAKIAGINVHCGHLPAFIDGIPYDPDQTKYSSWEEENLGAVEELLNTASDFGTECSVLMGDLNAGLAIPDKDVVEFFPGNFQMILDDGWSEPWDDPDCSYCADNPLAGAGSMAGSQQLDHIMFKGCDDDYAAYAYDRIFDEPVTIVDRLGEVHEDARLSDHYSFRVDVTLK